METVLVERFLGSRPQPHVVIDTLRHLAVGHHRQGPLAGLVGPHLHSAHPSQVATLHIGCRLVPVGIAALPLSHLYDTVILASSAHHQVALFDGVGQRFLHIYILTRFAGSHLLQTVPVVRSTDNHHVHILVVDHPAPVLHQLGRPLTGQLLQIGGPLIKVLIIYITHGDTLHTRVLQERFEVAPSLVATADETDFDFIARSIAPIKRVERLPHQWCQS